ncbi:MAG: hypothetical protein KF795_00975 [Labilithrix sp.]|nr:hypothetical protein [Labilithrix sp.]
MKTVAWIAVAAVVVACSSDPETTPSVDAGEGTGSNDAGGGGDGDVTRDDGGSDDAGGASCTAAAEQLLQPIDAVSTGEVTVLSEADGVKTLFVDASAGGTQGASANPRLYVSLENARRVDVTDRTAATSMAWDLAIKRPIFFTNSGDGGAGEGGAILIAKDFDAVTSADASGQTFAPESFLEDDCTAKVDATGAVRTSFDGWYRYDQATNILTPEVGTWLVKGATGKLYKLRILSYYATPDGGVGQSGGRYTLKVGAL